MRNRRLLAGLLLFGFAAGAGAQSSAANLLVGLGNTLVNLNDTVNNVLVGDVSGATVQVGDTVSTLLVDLSAGTPLVGLAQSGVALTDTVTSVALGVTPTVDRLTLPLAEAGAPLTEPVVNLTDQLLAGGLPVAADLNAPMPGSTPGLPLIGDEGLLGGLPLVGTLLGSGDAAPIIGGLIGGDNGLFAGTGPVPIVGGLFNAGALGVSGGGLSGDQLPLSAGDVDPATRSALANGVRLPGL